MFPFPGIQVRRHIWPLDCVLYVGVSFARFSVACDTKNKFPVTFVIRVFLLLLPGVSFPGLQHTNSFVVVISPDLEILHLWRMRVDRIGRGGVYGLLVLAIYSKTSVPWSMIYLESRIVHCAEIILQLPRHQQDLRPFVVHCATCVSVTCISCELMVTFDRQAPLSTLTVKASETSPCRRPVGFPSGFRLRSVGLNLGVVLRWMLAVSRHIPHLREAFGNTVRWLWVGSLSWYRSSPWSCKRQARCQDGTLQIFGQWRRA